jgi:hypothetical protein
MNADSVLRYEIAGYVDWSGSFERRVHPRFGDGGAARFLLRDRAIVLQAIYLESIISIRR